MSVLLRLLPAFLLIGWSAVLADEPSSRHERPARIGSIIVRPVFSVETGYDQNMFLSNRGPVGAALLAVMPQVRLVTDWSRHAIRLDLGLRAGLNSDGSRDNYLDGKVQLAGELDLTRRFRLGLRLTALRGHEGRGALDTPEDAAGPAHFLRFESELRGHLRLGAFRMAPYAVVRMLDYDDVALLNGGVDNQDDRDRTETEVGLELGLGLRRGYELLLRGGMRTASYDARQDDAGVRRDATQMFAMGGLRLRLTRLVEGKVTLGAATRDHADPLIGDSLEISGDAAITWWPTRRLKAKVTFRRHFGETALTDATGTIETEGSFAIRYELLRTLGLSAAAEGGERAFTGSGRRDVFLGLRLGIDWQPTRRLTIKPEYRFGRRFSTETGQGYLRHGLFMTATYAF